MHATTASGLATSTSVTATTSGVRPSCGEPGGGDEQPEQHEQPDLRDPGTTLHEAAHDACVRDPRIPDRESGEVRGEQPRSAEQRDAGVPRERDPDDDHGRDPGRRERQPSQQPDRCDADDDPPGDAEADLADEQERAVREPVVIRGLPLDEPDHEDRRERVVDPALELEHRLDPTAQADAPHGGEDRRRVGRRDDRSDQERRAPVNVERHVGRHRRDPGRDRHAERREQHRGADDLPDRLHVG